MRLRNNPKAYDIMAENSELVILDPVSHKGKFKDVFEQQHPLHIEIGMGKGDFIYEMARRNPDINFIGIEKFPSVIAAAINKINQKEKLNNLKLMHYDAIQLNDIFAKNEVDHIYLNFSDPWPKKRHAKRRLTSHAFLDVYKNILIDNGQIEFKTDNRGLFEYSLVSVNQYPMNLEYVSLDLHHSPEMENNVMTEYEKKFSVNGPIYKMIVSYGGKKNG